MDLYEAIKKRYACRSYASKPVEKDKLDRIIEAARLAPSAKNLQDWRFVVVTDEKLRKEVAMAANEQMFIATAPAIIVGCSNSDYKMRCGLAIASIDVAIAMEHIALAATAEGLASCWIGSFYPEKLKPILGIPDRVEIIEIMPVGYPTDKEVHRPRESVEKIVCYEKWQL
ncbi:MAG: nitroreductase family protein [Planctomycetaceae bacterium]|nr:nitroreductase family protein [Planctomycetaceae bacterium]